MEHLSSPLGTKNLGVFGHPTESLLLSPAEEHGPGTDRGRCIFRRRPPIVVDLLASI